jgi:hypothetical protein
LKNLEHVRISNVSTNSGSRKDSSHDLGGSVGESVGAYVGLSLEPNGLGRSDGEVEGKGDGELQPLQVT